MTFDPADLTANQLAESWRNDDCDYCHQTVNHRCRTASGNLCPPHTNRRVKYAAFLNGRASRDAEVADLKFARDEAYDDAEKDADAADAAQAALKTATDNASLLADQLKTARAGAALVPALQQQVADLLAKIADLTKPPVVTPPVPTDPPGWKPLLTENFDTLDTKVWDVKDKYAMGGRDDVSMAANVTVTDGKLRLWMRKEPATATNGETRQITTGNVWLRQKLPNEHRLEFTVTIPQQTGCWPGSVWETGSKSGAELDPCEFFPATKGQAKVTLHSRPYSGTPAHIMGGVTKALPAGPLKVTVEKRRTSVKVWWNDALVASYAPGSTGWDAAYWEDAAQVWQLWINLQSGGFGGKVDATTDWTKTYMDVESVRVWVPA